MEAWANAGPAYGLENVLRQNILASDYYKKTVVKLATWEEVVDEIYYSVKDVEPWMSGNARGPSSAFSLLHRLFTLTPTEQQVDQMLRHEDSPYIRAVGFLFLRYVGEPRSLWSWFEPYLKDDESFEASPGAPPVTIGAFARDILLDQYYFETIFPRVPKKVADEIVDALRARGLPTKALGNAGTGGADRRGGGDGSGRPASVKASLSVAFGQRAPNRAGVREVGEKRATEWKASDSPQRRGGEARDGEGRGGGARPARRSRSRSPQPERRRSRSRSRDRHDRRSERDRDDRRERDRRRSRSRERHERDRDDRRDRRRSRSRSRDRRRRSPSRERGGGRDARDAFRDAPLKRDVSDVFRDSASRDARSVFRESAARAGAGAGTSTYKY